MCFFSAELLQSVTFKYTWTFHFSQMLAPALICFYTLFSCYIYASAFMICMNVSVYNVMLYKY